jgi:hypothetical protein
MTDNISRFDRDPDALAWARSKVAGIEARYREYAESADRAGKPAEAEMWRYMANGFRHALIGDGSVIAAFDERRAGLPPSEEGEPS